MDFIIKLPRTKSGHDNIWVIFNRLTKSAYFLATREDYSMEKLARLYIDEIVARHTVPVSIISDRDGRRKPLEFEVGDQVLLKVSPGKRVIRFGKKGKLEPSVHDTFRVPNLKKCLADANLHVPLDEIKVDKILHFIERHIEIMDSGVKSLKRSKIPIVKVRWNSKRGPEFTWEREDHMKANPITSSPPSSTSPSLPRQHRHHHHPVVTTPRPSPPIYMLASLDGTGRGYQKTWSG
nr:putative reverse transcriptase domain-containing protein [Tanacetum cinerariifolium]